MICSIKTCTPNKISFKQRTVYCTSQMFLFRKDLNNLPCISSRVAEMISRMSPIVSLSFLQHRRGLTPSRRRSLTCNLQILGRNRAGMTERWSTSKDSCFQAILFISALFSSCPSVTESSRLSRLSRLWLKAQMSLRWVTEGLEVFCGGVSLKLNLWRLDGWSHKHLPSRSRRKKRNSGWKNTLLIHEREFESY